MLFCTSVVYMFSFIPSLFFTERVRQLRLELDEAISRAEEAELTVAVEQPQQDPAPEVQVS